MRKALTVKDLQEVLAGANPSDQVFLVSDSPAGDGRLACSVAFITRDKSLGSVYLADCHWLFLDDMVSLWRAE